MYVPKKNRIQSGGNDTTTVISLASTFNVDMSTVSTIVGNSDVTLYSQYNQMSPEQVANIIATLNTQISNGNTQVANLNAQIAAVENDINRTPDGILAKYNSILAQYTSTSTGYILASTSYGISISTYNSIMLEISTLRGSSIYVTSTLKGLESKYSSFVIQYMSTKVTIDADVSTSQQIYKKYITQYGTYESTISTYSGNVIKYNNISTECVRTPDIVPRYNDSLFDFTGVNSVAGLNGAFTVMPTGSDGTQAIWSKNAYNSFVFNMGYILNQSYIIMLSPKKNDVPSNKTPGSLCFNISNNPTNNMAIFKSDNSIFKHSNRFSTFNLTQMYPLNIAYDQAFNNINIITNCTYSYSHTTYTFFDRTLTIRKPYYIGIIFNQKMLLDNRLYSINTTTIAPFPFTLSESGNEKTYEVAYPPFPALPNVPYTETYAWSNHSFKTLSFTFMGAGVKVIFSTTNTGRPTKGFPGIFYGRATNRAKFTYNNSEAYIESGTGEPLTEQAMINSATVTYDGKDLNLDGVVCPNIFNGAPIYIGFMFAGTFNFDTTLFPKNILKIVNWTGTPDSVTIPNVTPAATYISSLNGTLPSCDTYISSISTSLQSSLSTINSLSSYMRSLDVDTLNKNISNAYKNLKIAVEVSSLYSYSTSTFTAELSTLWAVDSANESTIKGYTDLYNTYNRQLMSIDAAIAEYQSSLKQELSTLDSGARDYYVSHTNALLSEVQEYQYAARERNAFLGVLTADFKINRLNLYDEVDNLAFRVQVAANINDVATKTSLQSQRLSLIGVQGLMQSKIYEINPITVDYANLDSIFDNEYTYKESFINIRSTLYSIEREVLEFPSKKQSVKSQYTELWDEMNDTITNINGQITSRKNLISTIDGNIAPIKAELAQAPLNRYPFDPFPPPFPYQYTMISQQSNDPNTTTNFAAILKPIDFREVL
jgi:hypothetical protein